MSDKSFSRNQGDHRERSVVKLTNRLAKAKNLERRSIREDARPFLHAVRLHNRVKKASTNLPVIHLLVNMRELLKRTLGPLPNQFAVPKFLFSQPVGLMIVSTTSRHPLIFPMVLNILPFHLDVQFDMSPITPGLIKKILSKLSNSSAPGPDKIRY